MKNAIEAVLPGSSWQRCRTHFMRNLLTRVPKIHQSLVATLVRSIFDQPDRDQVLAQHARIVEQLTERFPDAANMLIDAAGDLLAFAAFPKEHWRQIWSNNPQERLNKELRRRTDVIGIFLRVSLAAASPSAVGDAARLCEELRVTRNLSVEPSALTLLGPVPSVPRGWPRDLIAA